MRFSTAATLVTRLEESQQQCQLERVLAQLDRTDLLICDELGYLTFSRPGAELLFQLFAKRYERKSLAITSNLPFGDWDQIFQGERMGISAASRQNVQGWVGQPETRPLPPFVGAVAARVTLENAPARRQRPHPGPG